VNVSLPNRPEVSIDRLADFERHQKEFTRIYGPRP
jgi:hypothetical protein